MYKDKNLEKSQTSLKFIELITKKAVITRILLAMLLSFIILSQSFMITSPSYAQNTVSSWSSQNTTVSNFIANQIIRIDPSIFGNHTIVSGKPVLVSFIGTIHMKELSKFKVPHKFIEIENPPLSPKLGEIFKKQFQSLATLPTKGKLIELELGKKNGSLSSSGGDPTGVYSTFTGSYGSNSPAEPTVAAGPDYVIETDNDILEMWNSHFLNEVNYTDLQTFFSSATYGAGVSIAGDPRVIYDTTSQRFFMSTMDTRSNTHTVDFAVSDSNDPTGTWHAWYVTFSGWADQPKIATSQDKFVIATNDPNDSNGAEVAVIDKSQLVSGFSNPRAQIFSTDTSSIIPYPVSTTTNDLYEVEKKPSTNVVVVHTISGDPSSFSSSIYISGVYLITPEQPEVPAKQPPNSGNIQIVTRYADSVQTAAWSPTSPIPAFGQIWFALTEGCTPPGDSTTESCLHIVQIIPCPFPMSCSPLQDIVVGDVNTGYYFPALSLDGSNNMNIIFGYSSLTQNPSLVVGGQATSAPLDSLDIGGILIQNTEPVTLNGGRWGDYYGAATDPSNNNLVWVSGMYNIGLNYDETLISEIQTSSGPITFPTTQPPFVSIRCSPVSLTIVAGNSGTTSCTITPQNGFGGTVALVISDSMGETDSLDNAYPQIPASGSTVVNLHTIPSYNGGPYSYTITVLGYLTNTDNPSAYFGNPIVSNPVQVNSPPSAAVATNQVIISPGSSNSGRTCTPTSCFNPQVVAIAPGDTITWTNKDTASHTATSGNLGDNVPGSIWDSYLIKPGNLYTSPPFNNVGTYNYFDLVHPWMRGQVIVTSNPIPEFGSVEPIIFVIAILSIIILSFKTRFLQRI